VLLPGTSRRVGLHLALDHLLDDGAQQVGGKGLGPAGNPAQEDRRGVTEPALNSRALRAGSLNARRSAASPTSTSPCSRTTTADGIVAERVPREHTSLAPAVEIAAENVVPMSMPVVGPERGRDLEAQKYLTP